MSAERQQKIEWKRLDMLAGFIEDIADSLLDKETAQLELSYEDMWTSSWAKSARNDAYEYAYIIKEYYEPIPSLVELAKVIGDVVASRMMIHETILCLFSDDDIKKLKELAVESARNSGLSCSTEEAMRIFFAQLTLEVLERLLEYYKDRFRKRFKYIDDVCRKKEEDEDWFAFERRLRAIKYNKEEREKLMAELQSEANCQSIFDDDDDLKF